jgi:signal transduction histidine kinase
LGELIQNAIIFSRPSEPVNLSVRAEDCHDPGERIPDAWRIVFRDNGIGFKSEESEIVFEPTVRLHGKSAFPGNGLGLTLVKKIMDNHGGRISAESREDGTDFILILPKTK